MKIAILTSGILPVPAVQGGAVETLVDHYLAYNDQHRLHDITVFSVWHPLVDNHPAFQSDVNHYEYINVSSTTAKIKKHLHSLLNRHTYYHYSIDYYFRRALDIIRRRDCYDCIILENRPGYALGLREATKARLVYHLHNDLLNSETLHGSELYRAASKIITVSDYINSRVRTCCADDTKTVTVHNGIDLDSFVVAPSVTRHTLGYSDDDFILAFSGRLIPEKGILQLVEAMAMLKDEPRVKLLVMGSSFSMGSKDSDDTFISALKSRAREIGDRIRFTGYIGHELVPDYLRLSDVAMIPSTWDDPFPTTVLEAMAAGLPIITTNRGGIPEMVSDQNAIVIPYPGDLTTNLAQAIRNLCHNEQQRKLMGMASKTQSSGYAKAAYAKNFFDEVLVEG